MQYRLSFLPATPTLLPHTRMHSRPRYFTNGPPPKRPRRGGRGGRGGRGRGGYRGGGVQLTPAEPGFRFFKQSFVENPWRELELRAERIARSALQHTSAPCDTPQPLPETPTQGDPPGDRFVPLDKDIREEAAVLEGDDGYLNAQGNYNGPSR